MLTPQLIAALPEAVKVLNEEIEYLDSMLARKDLPESVRTHCTPKRAHLVVVRDALAHVHHTNT